MANSVRALAPVIQNLRGPLRPRTRLYASDINGRKLGVLDRVRDAAVDMSNFRDAAWQLSLTMDRDRDFNPLEDWVKAEVEVRLRGEWVQYPFGLYKFRTKGGRHLRERSVWELEGYSAELLVLDDVARSVFTVAATDNILATVRAILLDRGVPPAKIRLPMDKDKAIGRAQIFDPFADSSKAAWLRICNSLLNSGGFTALYTDAESNFFAEPVTEITTEEPAVRYGPDVAAGEEPIVLDEVEDDFDDERFANAMIVSSEDPSQDPPITAVAENNDPDSAGSFQRLGRWVVKEIKLRTIPDQATADRVARAQLQAASGYYRTLGWRTPPDPERGPREYFGFYIPRKETAPVVGEFRGTGFQMGLTPHPQEMSFEASKIERVA